MRLSSAPAPFAIAFLGILGGGAWACSSTTVEGCACGTAFLSAVLVVVDVQGAPVIGVTLDVTRVNTSESLEFIQTELPDGSYIIMTDEFVGSLEMAGEVIRVEGQKDNASFSQDFVFGTDACRCHITRVSGPDSVTITSNSIAPLSTRTIGALSGNQRLAVLHPTTPPQDLAVPHNASTTPGAGYSKIRPTQ